MFHMAKTSFDRAALGGSKVKGVRWDGSSGKDLDISPGRDGGNLIDLSSFISKASR